jgi:hypothetical protein
VGRIVLVLETSPACIFIFLLMRAVLLQPHAVTRVCHTECSRPCVQLQDAPPAARVRRSPLCRVHVQGCYLYYSRTTARLTGGEPGGRSGRSVGRDLLLVSISIGQAVDVLRCLALAAAAWGASGASLVLLAAALRRYTMLANLLSPPPC